jgi:predicted DNA-binding protein (MmcQ/YjbR family)
MLHLVPRPVLPQDAPMSRARVNAICATFPGAERSDPWGGGHDAWKVGGKMFACIGAIQTGVSVKCSSVEIARLMIDEGLAARAPYFHASWVHLPETVGDDDLSRALAQSYRLVRAGLTKKAQAALAPF